MKRNVLRVICIMAAIIDLPLVIWVAVVALQTPKYVRPDTTGWHTGDVFFSVGDSWKSVAVRSLSGARNLDLSELTPSHSGIVVVDSATVKLVHESTSAGRIVMETPDEYIHNNGSYCIYARRSGSIPDSARLLTVIDSLMMVGVPFDYDFDHTEDQYLYCTEMVVRVFEICGCSDLSVLRDLGYIYPQALLNLTDSIR